MSTQPMPYITEDQYLELEESAEIPSEYYQGEMFPMEASLSHARISDQLLVVLSRELAESGYEVFSNKTRVRVSESGLYSYPDVLVVCGKVQVSERDSSSITNPKVIIEVLSPSTENYDQGQKFRHYQTFPTFCEYLLVDQDRIHAEHLTKQANGDWLLHQIPDGEEVVSLKSIGVSFKLREAYARIQF
jgi:Uma2 family endonuclease